MDENTNLFKIPTYRLQAVAEKFEKLNRRATKLGVPGVSYKVERTFTEEHKHPPAWDEFGTSPKANWVTVVKEYAEVSFAGEAPKLAGWTFCAVIEPIGENTNILRTVPGIGELPEKYRTAGNWCDHCQTRRRRKDTYVVREDATGTYKQVGSTCIQDFLGGATPDAILAQMEIITDAVACFGDEDDLGGFGRGRVGYNVADFLAVASAFVNRDGYVSRKAADEDFGGSKVPTGQRTFSAIGSKDYEIAWESVDGATA